LELNDSHLDSNNYYLQLKDSNIPKIKRCAKLLSLIFIKTDSVEFSKYNFFFEKSNLFIELLEGYLGAISDHDKNTLLNILELGIYRKKFSLNFNEDNIFHSDDKLSNLILEISNKIDLKLYAEDFYRLCIFLKNSISLRNLVCTESSPRTILILDGTQNNWLGEILKKHIEDNYYLDEIIISNYLDYYFKKDSKEYSLTFKLEIPPTFFPEIQELNWKAFFRDSNYLDSFNLCKRIK
ncbi:MAG: hypothetical protein ACRC40_02365, partial [Fusobacteriaceae bacterium]